MPAEAGIQKSCGKTWILVPYHRKLEKGHALFTFELSTTIMDAVEALLIVKGRMSCKECGSTSTVGPGLAL
jgi:hypothetical protein